MSAYSRGVAPIQKQGRGKGSAFAGGKAKRSFPPKAQGADLDADGMKCGGKVKGYAKGGRIDGCAQRGHTRGKVV